jgi:hypothetical protein
VLEVGELLELLHVELGAVEALLHVLGVAVGVGQELLELDEIELAALGFVEHLAAAVYSFGPVLAGHGTPLLLCFPPPQEGERGYSTGRSGNSRGGREFRSISLNNVSYF